MNINNALVDAFGRDVYTFGGPTAYKTETFKGYCVSLEWFQGNRSTEPMLVVWPASAGRHSGAWGICLSSVGKYATPEGKPTAEAFIEAADVLGVTVEAVESLLGRARRQLRLALATERDEWLRNRSV